MARTRSPGWKPAFCAALLGWIASTRAVVVCLPTVMNTMAKIAIAKMKLAMGPAATTAAREPTGLNWKLSRFSASLMPEAASRSGTLAAFSSPKNFT